MQGVNWPHSVHVIVATIALLAAGPSSAAPGDEHWSPQFGLAGAHDNVLTIALKNNRVYAAGYAGTVFYTNATVSIWDGIQWSVLGQFSGGSAQVYDLAFVGDSLYAAGTFTNVNGVFARGLARWNGSTWSSVGFNGSGLALAVDGNNLYVGGTFTNAGGVGMTNIGRWDGAAWSAVGAGLGRPNLDYVGELLATNGNLYAGGAFTNSGSQATRYLAVWNGSTWAEVGGGANSHVYALAWKDSQLYVGGNFHQVGITPAFYLAKWDGANWSTFDTGVGGPVNGIAFLSNSICVVGLFKSVGNGINATNFAVWNGSAWQASASGGLDATGFKAVSSGTNVYVGGIFLTAGGVASAYLTSWDGSRFWPVGTPGRIGAVNSIVRALASDGTNVIAGGSFQYAGQTNALRIARFDGTHWSAFGTGLNSNVLAVAAVGTNFYAAGEFTGGSGGPLAYHMGRWSGSQWVPLNNTAFATVNALVTRTNDLFIAGYFGITAADGTASWLTRWDGTNFWKVLAFGPDTFTLFSLDGIGNTAIAITDTDIYLSGNFQVTECDPTWMECTNSRFVMRFDGTYGRSLGTGLNTNANAIAVVGTNVYFGGLITNAGGVTVKGIARWDGNAWFDVGGGITGSGTILAMATIGTNLYVGGTFTNIGGVPARHIARWNGSTWSALGSGTLSTPTSTAGTVSALTVAGNDLYVGGSFRMAGGKESYFMGRWNESTDFNVTWLQLTQPLRSVAGPVQFTVTAFGVPTYVLEGSTNLAAWTPLLTNTITPYDHTDPDSQAMPHRLYRARSLP
jgi:hypothetical protein